MSQATGQDNIPSGDVRGDKVRILGVDPGLSVTGYGVVDVMPGQLEPALVEGGVFKFKSKQSVEARLVQLYRDMKDVIEEVKPNQLAIEKLYSHYNHPRTAIVMGHARGVILLAAQQAGLTVQHLGANEVKKSVTGYGHASKEQIQHAVQSQCNLKALPEPADLADAIAIALTHGRRLAVEQL